MSDTSPGNPENEGSSPYAPGGLDPAPEPVRLRQPAGLWCLFIVEMWERFSYYGMRAILLIYLLEPGVLNWSAESSEFAEPGRGWSTQAGGQAYGWYTGLCYLFPIFGGFIADRLIGTHRSMLVGAWLIMLGHITLAISGLGALATNDVGMATFIAGLALIVLGTGHFKPCVSVMVGQLYKPHDPRRDGGFTIFYMGINVGAAICPFIVGTLGERVGWHWGFGAAAIGMALGLIVYLFSRPFYLKGIGLPPVGKSGNEALLFFLGSIILSGLFGAFFYIGGHRKIGEGYTWLTGVVHPYVLLAISLLGILVLVVWFLAIQESKDRGPVFTILCFVFFNAFFWMAFEQAGSSLTLFARDDTNRSIFGWEMPVAWFQSVNPVLIVLLAPLYSIMWGKLGKRNMNPTQSLKITYGLILLGFGYLVVTAGGGMSAGGAKVGVWVLALTYLLHTMGELCLSPTGLSFVTKASPVKWVSFLMGLWFLSNFVANLGGGIVAGYVDRIAEGETELFWYGWFRIGGRGDFFLMFVISSFAAAAVALVLTPLFKRLLHGVE
ncbi:MAG: peptide MFS transporter [Phycisphaerales bacterium]|nr:MAG: peptide MFS transporter [Phycisphaerales bacterium]